MQQINGFYLNYRKILKQFTPEYISNAIETVLFYQATPDGSLCYKYETLETSNKVMGRITIVSYCNITATNKKNLLIIGKSAKA